MRVGLCTSFPDANVCLNNLMFSGWFCRIDHPLSRGRERKKRQRWEGSFVVIPSLKSHKHIKNASLLHCSVKTEMHTQHQRKTREHRRVNNRIRRWWRRIQLEDATHKYDLTHVSTYTHTHTAHNHLTTSCPTHSLLRNVISMLTLTMMGRRELRLGKEGWRRRLTVTRVMDT